MRFHAVLFCLATTFGGFVPAALSQEVSNPNQPAVSAKQLVVMIDGRFPTTGALTSGAGIVVGRKGGLVYIATARHVIEEFVETAVELKVQFSDRPGVEVDAFIIQSDLDDGIDLALIGVVEASVPDSIKGQSAFHVARLDPIVKKGEGVALLGQPAGEPWKVSPAGQEVLQSGMTKLEISSVDAQPGFSGGAAVDENYRIVGLIVSTTGSRVSIVPLAFIKELIEERSLPFDLVNTLGKLVLESENDLRIKKLRSLGLKFDKESYLTSIENKKVEAIEIFHQEKPLMSDEEILQWVISRQDSFSPEQRANVAYFAGHYDVPQASTIKNRIGKQFDLIELELRKARNEGLSIVNICKLYEELNPILFAPTDEYCSNTINHNMLLLYFLDMSSNYDPDGTVESENYFLNYYVPTWFENGEDLDTGRTADFYNTESVAAVPDCGYSISRTRFTVWENRYVIIPDFGKAISLLNAKYNLKDRGRDSDICYSFYYNGVKNTQHVQCNGEVLLHRLCGTDIVTFVSVRNHLISEEEALRRLNAITPLRNVSNSQWKASDDSAGIWPINNTESAMLLIECKGNQAYVRSSLSELVGLLPNSFNLEFKFENRVQRMRLTGQSGVNWHQYAPYAGFASRELLSLLAGNYSSVDLSIEGRSIGSLSLKSSSWAISKGLKDCY